MKRPFLTVYDYGMGGVWRVLLAESEAEIAAKYPELTVIVEQPPWMSNETLSEIETRSTVDIDDTTEPFLASLRKHRALRSSGSGPAHLAARLPNCHESAGM
jgi:hypothetical protein